MLSVCLHSWNILNAETFIYSRLEDWQVMFLEVANICFCSFPFPRSRLIASWCFVLMADHNCMIVIRMNCQAAENAYGRVSANL